MKYFLATRPYVVSASLIPFTIGALLAFRGGHFSWLLYVFGGISLMFIHLASNSANDYFDYKHGIDRPGTFGSSGSRLLINGKITLKEEKYVMIACFLLSIIFGVITVILSTPYILIFGLGGLIGGYFYTADPINLKYRGLSVPTIFVIYGVLITSGGYFLMTNALDVNVFLFATIIGLPVTNIVLANEIRDSENDKVVGIKSLTLIFGDMTGALIYLLMAITQFILLLCELLLKDVSFWSLLSFVSVPFYVRIIVKLFAKSRGKIGGKEIMNIDVDTSNAMLIFGIGIILGLL